ncbi:MAG TPA: Crp/Fnr family transcriptional regulator [Candidatus Limnocylindria bacterium]|jgi:CRP-like cAMP-binding protein|nr:Crp/Fnr family transcriptional regulator [Candidatus Limnocylindria bacterium]
MKEPCVPTAAKLGQQTIFRGVPWAQLEALAAVAACARFGPDELVFREGEEANRFYLLLSGSVALEAAACEREVRLQTVEAGEALGWSWVFPPFRWQFTARTLTPVEAYFFHAPSLRQHMEDDPALGYAVMKRMAAVLFERLVATRDRLAVVEEAAAGRCIPITVLASAADPV